MVGYSSDLRGKSAKLLFVGLNPTSTSKEVIMEEICKFIINNRIYTIYDVDKIEGKNSYVGQSNYDNRKVFIEKGTKKDMLLTLKHELMHIWLYENGHKNQNQDEVFDYEDMCELVALSNDSINRITKEYLKAKKYK